MSCGCENRKRAMELDRTRRLAKALAMIEGETVCIYENTDGTYGFDTLRNIGEQKTAKVTEYITRY